jgi:protein O-mannosyl-transferase
VLLSLPWFLPSLHGEFLTWDDDRNFLANPSYRGFGPGEIRWMLTTLHLGHWQPLTWFTLALDHALWEMRPLGYHVTNLALHGLNACLLFCLIRALLRRASPDAEDPSVAWAAAAGVVLFAAHPLRVEAVAWITERRLLLSATFILATLLLHLRSRRRAALLAHALAMLSATWGVVVPPLLVVLDGTLGRRSERRKRSYWVALIPFAAIAAAGLAVNVAACRAAGAGPSLAEDPFVRRAMQSCFGLAYYVLRTVVPVHLSPLHELAHFDPWAPAVLAGAAGVVALTVALGLGRRRRPGLWAAWLGYAVVLSPVLGLFQPVGLPLVADRYSYLAAMPWSAVVAALVLDAARKVSCLSRPPARPLPALVLALALGPPAMRYVYVWRDSVSLWTRAVEVEPASYIARTNLGHALELRGRMAEAIDQYQRSLAIRPKEPRTRYKLGLVYARQRRYTEAIAEWRKVLEVAPDAAEVYFCIGLASFRLGQSNDAVLAYRRAVALQPSYADALRAMADALFALGRPAEAERALGAARGVARPYRPPY